jgi:hypothetical protein
VEGDGGHVGAQRLRGRAAGRRDDATRLVPLDDQHSATEGSRELSGDLPLHQVQRFATIPNQPFAHLGKPTPIGPLAPRYAYDLLAKPLLTLGWSLSSELAARVLAYTNYLPILLQEVGHALVRSLQSRPIQEQLPVAITAEDIDAVLSSEGLARAIRERFTLTLNLDQRYTVIAYVMALDALESLAEHVNRVEPILPVRELRARCTDYWATGFADARDDEFRGLLEELVGLGILGRTDGSYQIRSPNVLRLLGRQEEIEDKLIEVAESPPPANFIAGDSHRLLTPGGAHSPLSEAQLADVLGRDTNQLRIVVGTDATNIASVGDTLEATERDTAIFTLRRAASPQSFSRYLTNVPERHHHVVIDDVRGVREENLRRAVAHALSRFPLASGASRSAVLVINPDQLPTVESALPGDPAEVVVPLRRYSGTALVTWALDVEGGFSNPGTQKAVLEATGGWPVLLDRLADLGRQRGAARALEVLRATLEEQPALLLEPLGLTESGMLAATWDAAVDLLAGGGADAETLAELLQPIDGVDPTAELRAASCAGLLVTGPDGLLIAERLVAKCWDAWRRGV